VLQTKGDWDGALGLCEVQGQAPPPIGRALLEALRLSIEFARGADVSAELSALRRFWPREGGVVIHAAPVAIEQAARRGDPAGVVAAYDDAVGVLSRIWHPWFSARIRLAAVAIGALDDCLPELSAAERGVWLAKAEELHSDGHTVLQRYKDPSGHWGPEGRAWVKRLDAELLRTRWLVGTDVPPLDVLVDTWREDVVLFGPRARGPAAARRAPGDRQHTRPQRRRRRRAHPAGEGDPRPRVRGQVQRRDRQAPVHLGEDRQRPRLQHPRQARRRRPHRGRRDRPAAGTPGLTAQRHHPPGTIVG
jgi:hypothetical protein